MSKTLTLVFLFAAPLMVSAHAFGSFYEAQSGPYTVDIGFSSPAPTEGEAVSFQFDLLDAAGEPAPFTSSWVRIENEQGATIFAGGLHNDPFGGPRMSYAFKEAGKYLVSARYDREGASIAEAAFPMTVVPVSGETRSAIPPYLYVAGGTVLVLVVGAFLFVRRMRS